MKTFFPSVTLAALLLLSLVFSARAQTGIDDVSVKAFGAAGDGVTDDTLAFQNALAAARAATNNGIYLPMGSYVISSTLTFSNLEMVGKFAGGWPADSMPMPTLLIRQLTTPGLILQNAASVHGVALKYDKGAPATTNAPAISLQGDGITLSSLRIQTPYDGITTLTTATANRARFSDIFIVQPTHVGVQLSKCSDYVQLEHIEVWCNSAFSTGPGFEFGSISSGTFNGLLAYQCTPAFQIYTDTSPGGGVFSGTLVNCCADASTSGIAITGNHQVRVMGGDWDCEFWGVTVNGSGAVVSIVGGKWHANSQEAIQVVAAQNVIIDSDIFYRSTPVDPAWAANPLVWIESGTTATVSGCQFITGSTGLELDSGLQRAVVTANSFEGGGIVNKMTSSQQSIANNLLP